jgi:hypothetical protein
MSQQTNIVGRIAPDKKARWVKVAQASGETLWSLIERAVDTEVEKGAKPYAELVVKMPQEALDALSALPGLVGFPDLSSVARELLLDKLGEESWEARELITKIRAL